MELRNVSLFKDVFPSKEKLGSSKRKLETVNKNSQGQNKDSEIELRHSKRVRIEKSFGLDFLTYMLEREPQTYKVAVNSTEGTTKNNQITDQITDLKNWSVITDQIMTT